MKRSIFRRRHLCFLVPLVLTAIAPAEARGATLERHPYLQQGSTTSMIVVWNTVADAQGELRWGTSPTALTNVVTTGLGGQDLSVVTIAGGDVTPKVVRWLSSTLVVAGSFEGQLTLPNGDTATCPEGRCGFVARMLPP